MTSTEQRVVNTEATMRWSNVHLNGVLEEMGENEVDAIFEETAIEIISQLMKDISSYIQEP